MARLGLQYSLHRCQSVEETGAVLSRENRNRRNASTQRRNHIYLKLYVINKIKICCHHLP